MSIIFEIFTIFINKWLINYENPILWHLSYHITFNAGTFVVELYTAIEQLHHGWEIIFILSISTRGLLKSRSWLFAAKKPSVLVAESNFYYMLI